MTTLDEKEILLLQILLDKITPQQMAHLRTMLDVDINYVKSIKTKLKKKIGNHLEQRKKINRFYLSFNALWRQCGQVFPLPFLRGSTSAAFPTCQKKHRILSKHDGDTGCALTRRTGDWDMPDEGDLQLRYRSWSNIGA